MTFFKHPNLPFPPTVRREIIFAAQQKSNTCDLTLALLQLLEDQQLLETLEIRGLNEDIADLQKEVDNLSREKEDLEETVEKLEDKLDKLTDSNY